MKEIEQENKKFKYYQITMQDFQDPAILNCFKVFRTHSQSPDITPLLQLIEAKEAAAREEEASVNNDNSHNKNSDLFQPKRAKK